MSKENNSAMIYSKKSHWSNLVITYVAIFAFLFQPLSPAIGAVLSDAYIQDQLNSYAIFEPTPSGTYQVPYYANVATPNATDLDKFVQTIESSYRFMLGNPTYVPIASGDITTIIPIFKKPNYVGTPAVQARYVRDQIHDILGRTLINANSSAYASEAAQLNTLYANAFTYIAASPSIRYGQKLNRDQENSGLAYDMIWPEFRWINGKEVVVPVVYLSKTTVDARRVSGNVTELNGNVSLGSLTIDGVDIQLGRQTFLKVAGDLLNNQGTINGAGELEIVAGGNLTNISGLIQAQGDLRIGAHSITNQTIVYRYAMGSSRTDTDLQRSRYGQIANFSAGGNLTLRSYSDIVFQGASASAGQNLTLAADGNIYLGSQILQESSNYGDYYSASSIDYLRSSLTATDTLKLIANGQIVIDAAELVSKRSHIELLAGLGITVEDDLAQSQFQRKFKSGQESAYKTVAMRALLDAGKGIRIHSEFGDITLKATDIRSTEGTSVTASNGGVNLLMTVENDHYSYNAVEKGTFTVKTINRGHEIETGVPNSIVGGFAVEALKGVTVEYEGDPTLTLDEQVANLAQFEGLEWMADVRANNPDVDWQAIELKYREWNDVNTSISPALAAVIAIVVAIVAGPGITELFTVGGSTGVAAGTSATLFGSTTLGAAAVAATTALASQAALALANGTVNGDIGGALEDLASSDTFKSLAIAAITAGALSKLDAQFFNAENLDANSALRTTETVKQTLANGTEVIKNIPKLSLTGQAIQAVTHATVQASVRSVIYENSFSDHFKGALASNAINLIGRNLSENIGEAARNDDIGTAAQYLAHAGVGCLTGTLTSEISDTNTDESCVAGAAGAVIGEYISNEYQDELRNDLGAWATKHLGKPGSYNAEEFNREVLSFIKRGVDIGRLSAAFTAFALGADADGVNIANTAATNAAQYNSAGDSVELASANNFLRARHLQSISANPGSGLIAEAILSRVNLISRVLAGDETVNFADTEFYRKEVINNPNPSFYEALSALGEQGAQAITSLNPKLYLELVFSTLLFSQTIFNSSQVESGSQSIVSNDVSAFNANANLIDARNIIREIIWTESNRQQALVAGNDIGARIHQETLESNIYRLVDVLSQHPDINDAVRAIDEVGPNSISIIAAETPTEYENASAELESYLNLVNQAFDDELENYQQPGYEQAENFPESFGNPILELGALGQVLPGVLSESVSTGSSSGQTTSGGGGAAGDPCSMFPELCSDEYQAFENNRAHESVDYIPRNELVNVDGVWYVRGTWGLSRAKGNYEFVTINGRNWVSNSSRYAGHHNLSRGANSVDYAGTVRFGRNGSSRGQVRNWDNHSGHYKPKPNAANQAGGLPLDKFIPFKDVP